jgi:hypothetical protein
MLVTVLFSLAACGTQPEGPPDFFHGQAQFDAARARQTTVVDVASTGEACAQVIAVLMDLDCSVQAVNSELGLVSARNSELGLVSARASVHRVPPAGYQAPVADRHSCAGHRVTVSVAPRQEGQVAVRASFTPPSERADQAFRTLLRKSLSHSLAGGSGSE